MDKGKGVISERMMQYVPKRGRRAIQRERMIVLTHAQLQCVNDNRQVKVNIHLAEVKAVEELDDIAYAFQVVYIGKDGWNALYLVCVDESQRHDWMKLVTHASKGRGADFDKRYHSGVYEEAIGRFTCCNKDRNTPGCQEKTVRMKDTVDQTELHQNVGGGSILSLVYESTPTSWSFHLEVNPSNMLSAVWSYFTGK